MAEYLHPGVYVQEVPSAVKPIEGVSTSTAAFIGVADKGPVPGTLLPTKRPAQPVLVTSFTDYSRQFGGFRNDSFLTYAVQAFFQNGGQQLYVVRVIPPAPTSPPSSPPVSAVAAATGTLGSGAAAMPLSAANQGTWGNNIWVQVSPSSDGDPTNSNFKLQVMCGASAAEAKGNVVESYDNVTFEGSPTLLPGAINPGIYARQAVNSRSEYIAITGDFTASPLPASKVPQIVQLGGGGDGDTSTVNFVGQPAATNLLTGSGIYALDKITDVNLIAIPGQGDIATVNAGVEYCKNQRPLQDCFFIGDMGSITADGTPTGATDVPLARTARLVSFSTTPRNPSSETIRFVPPPITTVPSPLPAAIFCA